MVKILTQTAQDEITRNRAAGFEDVLINGASFKPFTVQSSYSYGKDFAAASASVTLNNVEGRFSPNGPAPIKLGDEIIITEGIFHPGSNTLELYSGFTGKVRRRSINKKDNTISLECADLISELGDTDIDMKAAGTKVAVADEVLEPNFLHLFSGTGTYSEDFVEDATRNYTTNELRGLFLFDHRERVWPIKFNTATKVHCDGIQSGDNFAHEYSIGEGLSQVFDSENDNWTNFPLPSITTKDNTDNARAYNALVARDQIPTEWSGFNINYESGQVIVGLPIDAVTNSIEASYSYFSQGIYVEDVLETVITTVDGYGNAIFTVEDNLKSKFSDHDRVGYDGMTPNFSPDTDPDVFTKLSEDIDSTATTVRLRKGTDFFHPIPSKVGYLQIDKEVIKYEGLENQLASGISRAQMGTAEQEHTQGADVFQIYPAGQFWFTKFNNITDTIDISDFSLNPSEDIRGFNNRFGRLTLEAAIAVTADVRLNTDYNFKTLQATGVQINEVEFRERDFKNRTDVIKRLKDFVAPNYTIRTEGGRNIWASYVNQKFSSDYTLSFVETIDHNDEEDVFTHVKLYAENNNPNNLMTTENVSVVQSKYFSGIDAQGAFNGLHMPSESFTDGELTGLQLKDNTGNFFNVYGNTGQDLIVSGQPISGNYEISRFYIGEVFDRAIAYQSDQGDYYKFNPGVGRFGRVIANYPQSPKIKINGVQLDGPKPVAVGPVPVKKITDTTTIIAEVTEEDGQTETKIKSQTYKYLIKLPHTDIVPDIYNLSDQLIDTANDIFLYLVGEAGGGIRASIQFFSNEENIVPYVAGNFADVSQLDPLFTIPINDPNVNYRKGVWRVTGIPSYQKIVHALYQDINPDSTSIQFVRQRFYQFNTGMEIIERIATGTCTITVDKSGIPKYVVRNKDGSQFPALIPTGPGLQIIFIDADNKEFKISSSLTPSDTIDIRNFRPTEGEYHIYGRSADKQSARETIDPTHVLVYEHQSAASEWVETAVALRNPANDPRLMTFGPANDFSLGRLFAYVVPREFPWTWNSAGDPNYEIYSRKTGQAAFEAMKYGGINFDDPASVENPTLTIDRREVISFATLTKVREWEKKFDLYDTLDGSNVLPKGAVDDLTGNVFLRPGGIPMRVVNEIWQMDGCERGIFGSTAQAHFTNFDDDSFFATANGTNITQKKFYYKDFQPGAQITDVDKIGSAIYYVWHEDDGDPDFYIDYEDNTIAIKKEFFTDKDNGFPQDVVQADFSYAQRLSPITNYELMFDGRYDTKAQTQFTIEPLPGTEVFTIDFGRVVQIDAIDILGGYYSLQGVNTGIAQIAFSNQYTLKFSLDNITYLLPTDKADTFTLASGDTFSLEREDLGTNFQTRFLKLEIEKAQRHDIDNGLWFVSIADFRCYNNTVLIGDGKLVARLDTGTGAGTLNTLTDSTQSWTINQFTGRWLVDSFDNEFHISSNTATALTVSGTPNSGEYWIFEDKQVANTVYDKDDLLTSLGDKLFKNNTINDRIKTQRSIDNESKQTLKELIKNNARISARVGYHPAVRVGQTFTVIDNRNNVNKRYFVENVSKDGMSKTLILGHYPNT